MEGLQESKTLAGLMYRYKVKFSTSACRQLLLASELELELNYLAHEFRVIR
jgi:hypothetical protein